MSFYKGDNFALALVGHTGVLLLASAFQLYLAVESSSLFHLCIRLIFYVLGDVNKSRYFLYKYMNITNRLNITISPIRLHSASSLQIPRSTARFNLCNLLLKKGKRKVQGVPQSQTAALPRPQEEEETDKSKQAQTEQTYEKH